MNNLNNIQLYKLNKLSRTLMEEFIYNNKPSYINLKR